MSTPVINAIDNVNQSSLESLFTSVANNAAAQDNLSQSDRNIDKVSTNRGVIESLNSNSDAVRKILCRREGRDPANYPTLSDVASDVSLVQSLSVRGSMQDVIRFSAKAEGAMSTNDRAARELVCHPAGLDATTFTSFSSIPADDAAMDTIVADSVAAKNMASLSYAMGEVAAVQTAMQKVIGSVTARETLVEAPIGMTELASSQPGMAEVAASQAMMNDVVTSSTAMNKVTGSSTAMTEIGSSTTAMIEVGNSALARDTVVSSSTATAALDALTTFGDVRGSGGDRCEHERHVINGVNKSYPVYFADGTYDGYCNTSSVANCGFFDSDGDVSLGKNISQTFVYKARMGWDSQTSNCNGNQASVEFNALI